MELKKKKKGRKYFWFLKKQIISFKLRYYQFPSPQNVGMTTILLTKGRVVCPRTRCM